MKEKVNYRIDLASSVLLIMFATLCDALSLIPFVGDIVAPIFWLIVGIYLWTKGMSLLSGRKLATTGISIIAEMIPAVQELPALLLGIITILIILRIEDKTGISTNSIKKPGTTNPRNKVPLNSQPGIRLPNKNQ